MDAGVRTVSERGVDASQMRPPATCLPEDTVLVGHTYWTSVVAVTDTASASDAVVSHSRVRVRGWTFRHSARREERRRLWRSGDGALGHAL